MESNGYIRKKKISTSTYYLIYTYIVFFLKKLFRILISMGYYTWNMVSVPTSDHSGPWTATKLLDLYYVAWLPFM